MPSCLEMTVINNFLMSLLLDMSHIIFFPRNEIILYWLIHFCIHSTNIYSIRIVSQMVGIQTWIRLIPFLRSWGSLTWNTESFWVQASNLTMAKVHMFPTLLSDITDHMTTQKRHWRAHFIFKKLGNTFSSWHRDRETEGEAERGQEL